MKKIVVAAMLGLIFATMVDAAPRKNRRARRRAARQTTQVRPNRYQQVVVPHVAEGETRTAYKPVVDPVPTVDTENTVTDPLPTVEDASTQAEERSPAKERSQAKAVESGNAALAELNSLRRRRGLRTLVEDTRLTAIALRKATIQANRGRFGHPGGTMGGARFEGVGVGSRFTTCYQYASNVTYAGAASVIGVNGRRYHCLLLR